MNRLPEWYYDPQRGCSPQSGNDPDLWFTKNEQLVAVRICARCPFKLECDELADQNGEQHGVWGGRIRSVKRNRNHNAAAVDDDYDDEQRDDVDHLIALVLAGRVELFNRLDPAGQGHAVRTGLAAGRTIAQLARLWSRDMNHLLQMAGMPTFDQQVAELFQQEPDDEAIAKRLSVHPRTVAISRHKQRLLRTRQTPTRQVVAA